VTAPTPPAPDLVITQPDTLVALLQGAFDPVALALHERPAGRRRVGRGVAEAVLDLGRGIDLPAHDQMPRSDADLPSQSAGPYACSQREPSLDHRGRAGTPDRYRRSHQNPPRQSRCPAVGRGRSSPRSGPFCAGSPVGPWERPPPGNGLDRWSTPPVKTTGRRSRSRPAPGSARQTLQLVTSAGSITTSVRPWAVNAASTYSKPNRISRSRCSTTMVVTTGIRNNRIKPRRCPFSPEPISLTTSVTRKLFSAAYPATGDLAFEVGLLVGTGHTGVQRHATLGRHHWRMPDHCPGKQLFCWNRQFAILSQPPSGFVRQSLRFGPYTEFHNLGLSLGRVSITIYGIYFANYATICRVQAKVLITAIYP